MLKQVYCDLSVLEVIPIQNLTTMSLFCLWLEHRRKNREQVSALKAARYKWHSVLLFLACCHPRLRTRAQKNFFDDTPTSMLIFFYLSSVARITDSFAEFGSRKKWIDKCPTWCARLSWMFSCHGNTISAQVSPSIVVH